MPDDPEATATSTVTTTSTAAAATDPAATSTAQTATAGHQETFSREYVENLRRENASYRKRAEEASAAAEAEKAAAAKATAEKASTAEAAAAEAKKQLTEFTEKANQRIIRTELNSEAKAAGMVDLDGLKLADLSTVKLDENGNVTGAKELIEALKKAKPYLFEEPKSSTSQSKAAPGKSDAKVFDARKATPEEIKADAKARGLTIRTH